MITFKNVALATVGSRDQAVIKKKIDVKIHDNVIVAIGENLRAEGEIIEGDYLLTPGFVQAHIHPTNILIKGIADNLDWNSLVVESHKVKSDDIDERTLASLQCFVECAKGGATSCLSSSSTLEEIYHANRIIGSRVFAFGMPKDLWNGEGEVRVFDKGKIKEMFDGWRLYDTDVFTSHYGIASFRAASDSLIDLVLDSALANQKMFAMHIAQAVIDLETTLKEKKAREVEYLHKKFRDKIARLGRKSFFIHAALVDEREVEYIKELGTNVVICAGAMAKIGTGFAPLRDYLDRGINILLGTDNARNNDSNNILAEAQFTALAYKAKEKDAGFLTSLDIFRMLTANGEKAGLGKIGRLEEGYLADINVFDLDTYPFDPSYNYLHNLIFNGFNARPVHVLANGRFIIKNYEAVLKWGDRLLVKYGIRSEKDLFKTVGKFVK